MKTLIAFIIFFVGVGSLVAVAYLALRRDEWIGFYYKGGDFENKIISPKFQFKDSCINWAYTLKRKYNNLSDDFECGKNCQVNQFGTYVCDETSDIL